MVWLYNDEVFELSDPKLVGFVYCITNLTNNRKYVGKKLFYAAKTRIIKKKKRRFKVESDWKDYYGSNQELQEDVVSNGPEKFKREILRLCTTKAECSYYEAKYQFEWDVILSHDYYNGWISCKITKMHMQRYIIDK